MKARKYFLYARKSSEDDEHQLLSIDAQLKEVREFAKKEGLNVAKEFVETRTAKTPGRPVFDAMLQEVELGDVCGLLAWHPDRLARNSIDGGRVIYFLDIGKLNSLKFPTFWFENTPQGKFMLNISFGQSKYYVDNLAENVKRGIREKLRRGEYPGKAPTGYLNDPKSRTVVVDQKLAEYVARLFEAYAKGKYGLAELRELSELWGLSNIWGKPLSDYALRKILRNPFYTGVFMWCGQTYEGKHEALIDWKLFDRVQAVLHKKCKGRYQHRCHFAFVGMMICGKCGCSITAERQKKHNYYRCTQKGAIKCPLTYIREEVLAEQFEQHIRRVALSPEWAEPMLEEIGDMRAQATASISMEIKRTQEQHDSAQRKLDRLLDAYLENAITKPEYLDYKATWIPKKVQLAERMKALQAYRNPALEQLEVMVKAASEAHTIASTENLDDMKEFYQGINAELILGPDTIEIPKGRTRFRNQEILLNKWTVPRLSVIYPPEWRILDERADQSNWHAILASLESALGVSHDNEYLKDTL